MQNLKDSLDALSNKVQDYSVPLYVQRKHGKLEHIATGFLATKNKQHFFLTAGHSIHYIETVQNREGISGPLVIAFGKKVYPLDKPYNRSVYPKSSSRPAALLDIAIVNLSPFPNIIENAGNQALDLNNIPSTDMNNQLISIMGFPNKTNKYPVPYGAENQSRIIPHAQRNLGSPLSPEFDMTKIGLSNNLHYAFQWGAKDTSKQYIPEPRGMSGAPVWASERTLVSEPRLVGVFINYFKQHSVAAFTRIDAVAGFIDAVCGNKIRAK